MTRLTTTRAPTPTLQAQPGIDVPCSRPFVHEFLAIAGLLIAQLLSPYAGALSIGLLCVWAMRGPRQSLQSLSIVVLIVFLNRALVPIAPGVSALRWVLLAIAAGHGAAGALHGKRFPLWLVGLLVFVVPVGAAALIVSVDAALSLLKLASITLGVVGTLGCFETQRGRAEYWTHWFVTLHAVVLVLSAPLLLLPAGYNRTGWAFQGITDQPQTLAIYIVPVLALQLGKVLMSARRGTWDLTLLAADAAVLALSGSRTGLLAAVAGVSLAFCTALLRGGSTCPRKVLVRSSLAWFSGIALLLVLAQVQSGPGGLRAFLLKGYEDDPSAGLASGVAESVQHSRGTQVSGQLEASSRGRLLAGTGFGIGPEGLSELTERDPVLGIPLSSPTEAGFLPIAVLSQTGLLGCLVFAAFFASILRQTLLSAPSPMLALFWAALAVNFGEMIFFAAGSLGLQMWLLIGLSRLESAK